MRNDPISMPHLATFVPLKFCRVVFVSIRPTLLGALGMVIEIGIDLYCHNPDVKKDMHLKWLLCH